MDRLLSRSWLSIMKKLHWLAVAEGLKTGNHGKGPILSECLVAVSLYKSIAAGLLCYGVKKKSKSSPRCYREARRRAKSLIHTIKNLDQGLVRKKLKKFR